MTVKEVMTGITPSADYAGLGMADDFVLAFQTADTQQDVNDYIVCQECITEHSAAVNPGTQDKQYIRKGNATIKTSAQRTFSISGDRTHGDAWQDWVTSLAVMFGTGSAVIVPEHGAAVRGDKIQVPRLRDIPTMRISRVPVMVKFVGLKNFIRVFSSTSSKYWLSVGNTFVFAIGKLLVEIPLALVLAFILTKKIRGRDFFRSVFFMPSMLSVAVIGVVFTYLFNHNQGVVNSVIRLLGGEGVKWFSGGTSAMIMLMIASIWQNFGINMLFFMTGLQAIPPEMYEAASIDGASNTRQFLTITIPLLGPVLQMVLMNAILGSLKVTDLVLTLTNGKPSGKTEVMMTYIYKKFFGDGGASGLDFGYGAALTVVTAVILGIVTLIYLRATKKSSDVY